MWFILIADKVMFSIDNLSKTTLAHIFLSFSIYQEDSCHLKDYAQLFKNRLVLMNSRISECLSCSSTDEAPSQSMIYARLSGES